MAMTRTEELGKREIMKLLAKQGYKAYAKLLDLFDLNITDDPNVVAYMQPGKARIVVNRNLRLNQISTVVRHEILHEYLKHQDRLMKHLAKQAHLDYDTLSDMDLKELQNKLYSNQIFNIAGDYEISNKGYTEADKDIVHNLWLNGQQVRGLVTEDDHPDWVNLSVEEMYDKLNKEMNNQENQLKQQLQDRSNKQRDQSDIQSGQNDQQNKESTPSANTEKKPLEIGNQGDPEIQAQEEAERTKQIAKEMADEMKKGDSTEAKCNAEDLQDVADKADSLVKDIKDGKVDVDEAKELEKRVADIEKAFKEAATDASIIAETEEKIKAEKIDKKTREMLTYMNDDMNRFEASIGSFIKKALTDQKSSTWRRPNRRSTGGAGEPLRKGRQWQENKHIPSINVYFDQSGSWGESDIKEGLKVLGTFNRYRDKGSLKMNVKFFADHVHDNAEDARKEGGTDLASVFKDIENTHPDNVVIMTDRDGDYNNLSYIEVPGVVWLLFKNGERSQKVIDHLHGRTQTQIFDIKEKK